jgi:hypothetical protein
VFYLDRSEMTAPTSKWTAFLLSACVPGAGQLAARSWTCLAWFASAGLLVAGFAHCQRLFDDSIAWLLPLQFGAGVAMSLLSAEHAKRLLEPKREPRSRVTGSSVQCAPGMGRNLDILISLNVACSGAELWSIIRDLPRFLTIDPFHDAVTLMRVSPAAGVDLVLSHNAFGCRFLRFGRIIAWREESGYTFSDLSPRGPRIGFPHVFIVKLDSINDPMDVAASSRLTIRVRGKWTSRLAPVWLGRLWVWLVCREHARLLRRGL